jgi:predicted phage terminase large subunit-like protein
LIFEGTYQGNPTPASGYTFRREWWAGEGRRYDLNADNLEGRIVARFQSWDTAEGDGAANAYTVCVTGDIWHDYRLAIRHVYRARLTFDALPAQIEAQARQWNGRGLLRRVVIEDKSSGRQAFQTLRVTAQPWLKSILHAWQPAGSKDARAAAASVWCANGMILLPEPGAAAPWLMDFEDELFSFPQSSFLDQADAFSQLALFCENYLSEGWRARGRKTA